MNDQVDGPSPGLECSLIDVYEENTMKKIVSVIAVLLLAVAEACGGPPANLLIGKWKLTSGATGCNTSMTYAPKSVTQTSWMESRRPSR